MSFVFIFLQVNAFIYVCVYVCVYIYIYTFLLEFNIKHGQFLFHYKMYQKSSKILRLSFWRSKWYILLWKMNRVTEIKVTGNGKAGDSFYYK